MLYICEWQQHKKIHLRITHYRNTSTRLTRNYFTIALAYVAIRPLVLSGLSLTFVFHYIQHLTHYTTFITFPLDKVVVPVKCPKEMSDMNLFSIIDLPPVILALVSGNLLITFVLDCLFFAIIYHYFFLLYL